MNYFVIMPDGKKFGPASLGLLNQWIQQSRLKEHNLLEDEMGVTKPASEVEGLNFNPAMPISEFSTNYPRGSGRKKADGAGLQDTYRSWTCIGITVVAGIFFGPLISPVCSLLGVFFGFRAVRQTHYWGLLAALANCYVALIWISRLILLALKG
jgi:hypothetical protein